MVILLAEIPSAPLKLGVANVTKDSITIAWTRPDYDGGSRVTSYLIDALEKGQTKWVKCATVKSMTHTIKSLREGAEYFFRVRAENHAGLSEPKEMIVPVLVKEIHGMSEINYVLCNLYKFKMTYVSITVKYDSKINCSCEHVAFFNRGSRV